METKRYFCLVSVIKSLFEFNNLKTKWSHWTNYNITMIWRTVPERGKETEVDKYYINCYKEREIKGMWRGSFRYQLTHYSWYQSLADVCVRIVTSSLPFSCHGTSRIPKFNRKQNKCQGKIHCLQTSARTRIIVDYNLVIHSDLIGARMIRLRDSMNSVP